MKQSVYTPPEFDIDISSLEVRIEPDKVLMCPPDYFKVIDIKNPYMDPEKEINIDLAKTQWSTIHQVFLSKKDEGILREVNIINAVENLEDMVFCANQTFPWITKHVFISTMNHHSRQKEVPHFKSYFESSGYQPVPMPFGINYEGMGDTIPLPGKKLLFGGYGFRSDKAAYHLISQVAETPVILLKLKDDRFYHLDTCFLPVSEKQILIFEGAFEKTDIKALERYFELIPVPEEEALNFSLNAYVHYSSDQNSRFAIIQKGNPVTKDIIEDLNYKVVEVETSEFMKSGGSVFCMKMMYY